MSSAPLYVALYSYVATSDDELTVRRGQKVYALEFADHSGDTNWWKVCLQVNQKREGFVPAMYLGKVRQALDATGSTPSMLDASASTSTPLSPPPIRTAPPAPPATVAAAVPPSPSRSSEQGTALLGVAGGAIEMAPSTTMDKRDQQSSYPSARTARQAAASTRLRRDESREDGGNSKKLQHVLDELLETERNFVTSISVVNEVFVQPLCARLAPDSTEPIIMTRVHIRRVFGELPTILAISSALLAALEQCVEYHHGSQETAEGHQRRSVASVMSEFAPLLRVYATYVENYDAAMVELQRIMRKHRSIREFVLRSESDERCMFLPLESLLVMPVQRVPRYKLMMDEYVKHLQTEDARRGVLAVLGETLGALNEHLNAQTKAMDARSRIALLGLHLRRQRRVPGRRVIMPHRWFVTESPVHELTLLKAPHTKVVARKLLLLSDCVVVTRGARLMASKRSDAVAHAHQLTRLTWQKVDESAIFLLTHQHAIEDVVAGMQASRMAPNPSDPHTSSASVPAHVEPARLADLQQSSVLFTATRRRRLLPRKTTRFLVIFASVDDKERMLDAMDTTKQALLALERNRRVLIKLAYQRNGKQRSLWQKLACITPWWAK